MGPGVEKRPTQRPLRHRRPPSSLTHTNHTLHTDKPQNICQNYTVSNRPRLHRKLLQILRADGTHTVPLRCSPSNQGTYPQRLSEVRSIQRPTQQRLKRIGPCDYTRHKTRNRRPLRIHRDFRSVQKDKPLEILLSSLSSPILSPPITPPSQKHPHTHISISQTSKPRLSTANAIGRTVVHKPSVDYAIPIFYM